MVAKDFNFVTGGKAVNFWKLDGATLAKKAGRFGKKYKQVCGGVCMYVWGCGVYVCVVAWLGVNNNFELETGRMTLCILLK